MFLPHQDKRGYLDVVLSLLDVKDHVLYELIPQMVEPHVSRALQEHFGTVENYRTCVPFGDKAVDLAWQASWPITHKKLSTFRVSATLGPLASHFAIFNIIFVLLFKDNRAAPRRM